MYKMYACHYFKQTENGRRAKFAGWPIQAKSWNHAQEIADKRGNGTTVDGIYG